MERMEKEIRSATTTETQLQSEESKGKGVSTSEREKEFRAAPKLDTSPVHGLWALTNRDLKKWYKNPIQLIISLVQPIVWLGLFGKALNFGSFISSAPNVSSAEAASLMKSTFGVTDYFTFLAAGMLAMIILFTAAFSGMSVVFDKRFGFMNKALSTPIGRGSIVIGKVLTKHYPLLDSGGNGTSDRYCA